MRILITGASGFIGKHLAEHFSETYHVFIPTHKQLDLLDEDAVQEYFRNHRIDLVIHCAVIGGSGPNFHVKDQLYENIRIFFNLARNKKYYKRFINISSGAVYDKRFPIVTIKESDFGKRIPDDEYGLYKFICSAYIHQHDHMLDLRVFGIFGEGEDYRRRFISNALCRHMYGLPITIRQNVYFDYLDVMDFVMVVDYFIRHEPKYNAYNVGRGKKIDLLSIAKEIVKLSGNNHDMIVMEKKFLANEYTCSTNRLLKEYSGFRPTPLDSSLQRLSQWYSHHRSRIDKKEL
jgi:GDP-L-fucose synthase